MTKKEAAAVLRKAAKIMDQRGLYKGWFYDSDNPYGVTAGPVCAWGAIRAAIDGEGVVKWSKAADQVADVLNAAEPGVNRPALLAGFNDDPGTTKPQVIAELCGLACKLEALELNEAPNEG